MPSNYASAIQTELLLPINGILPLAAGYSVPTDFSALSSNLNRLIIGASTAESTGGSDTVATATSDTGDSAHNDTSGYAVEGTQAGSGRVNDVETSGVHVHPVTFTHRPKRAGVLLIRATKSGLHVPVGGILLGEQTSMGVAFEGDTSLNDQSAYLSGESATAIVSAVSIAVATATTFPHKHHDNRTYTGTNSYHNCDIRNDGEYAGPSHPHSGTPSYSASVKAAILMAFKRTSAARCTVNSPIIMFDGTTIPDKWALCDGSNDTINLIGYFIKLSSSGSLVGTHEGNNTISGAVTFGNDGGHDHDTDQSDYEWSTPWGHNSIVQHYHGASFASKSFTPVYRTLKFIQFKG